MFFFWGPFFFVFPVFIIYMVVRHIIAPPKRHHSRWYLDEYYRSFEPGYSDSGPGEESNQVTLYKLAYKLEGRITVSDIVIETGMEVKEAEELIQSMVDNQRVRMEVDENGMLLYEFPEIIARLKQGSSHERSSDDSDSETEEDKQNPS
ncbi:MAG: hypothetical protein K9M94_04560 [Spirochaetia bacterium]|nr:hypothetical protein [Spirochaetia bacterium]